MILACNQPYFIPYIGYWQLINCADLFIIDDDYNYIKKGWVNRNRILNNGTFNYLTLPIDHASDSVTIDKTFLADIDKDKILRKIDCLYHKAPNFSEAFGILNQILSYPEKNLSLFLANSIQIICDYLDIKTKIIFSSSLTGNSQYKCEYRIYDQCARVGADTYINAIGGTALYDFEEFRKHDITLKFIKSNDIVYKQFNHDFVPNLSILDVIMFNTREEAKQLLHEYTLLDK